MVIVLLLLWIYYSGGGTPRTRKLTARVKELESENEALKETNRALRSGLSSTDEGVSRPVAKMNRLAEKLVRVKDAMRGSRSANKLLEQEFDFEEIGPSLIQDILSTEEGISVRLKRRLAHGIFVGDIGREIMFKLDEGVGLNDAIVKAGVPLRVGKERVRILKEIGYLNNRLNLTDWGIEALEL